MRSLRNRALILTTLFVGVIGGSAAIALVWYFQEPPTVDFWIERLETGSFWQKERAHKELVALSPQSVPALVVLLKRGGPKEGWNCLADIGDAAVPDLLDLVSDRYEPKIRKQAMAAFRSALGNNPAPTITKRENVAKVVEALSLCLKDNDAEIRRTAAWNLASIRRETFPALEALKEALNDADDWVKVEAARAVAALEPSDPSLRTTLCELITCKDNRLKEQALGVVSEMGPSGAFAFEIVKEIAADPDASVLVRQRAIWTLGELGPTAKQAIPVLQDLLNHKERRLRDAAAKSLNNLENQ